MTPPAPGWYPNPEGPGLRWWDGTRWGTSATAPGWYPNPEGPGLRWWDGTRWPANEEEPAKWTERAGVLPSPGDTGDVTETEAHDPASRNAAPPADPVTALQETGTTSTAPTQGVRRRSVSGWWVLGSAIGLAGLLGLIAFLRGWTPQGVTFLSWSVVAAVVISTVWLGFDSHRLNKQLGRKAVGPTPLFVIGCILLWIVTFPIYLFRRHRALHRTLAVDGPSVTCQSCGFALRSTASYCPACGAKAGGAPGKCPMCDGKIEQQLMFCWTCYSPGPAASPEQRQEWLHAAGPAGPPVYQGVPTPAAWYQRWFSVAGLCVVGAVAAWALSANPVTGAHLDNHKIDTDIAKNFAQILAQNGGPLVSVDCPSDQPLSSGHQFVCPISEDGKVIAHAHVTVLNSSGEVTWVIFNGSTSAITPSTTPATSSAPASGICRSGNPLAGVVHPEGFLVQNPCITVRGTVAFREKRPDGDVYFYLALPASETHLLNLGNYRVENGLLRVDIVPADQPGCTPGQPPPIPPTAYTLPGYNYGICTGADIATPPRGAEVSVIGAYVLNSYEGEMEIHPVWSVRVLSTSGSSDPLSSAPPASDL